MDRYILRYREIGPEPSEVREYLASPRYSSVKLIDASPRMFLVEAPETTIRTLGRALTGWLISPEQPYFVPDHRPRPKRVSSKHRPAATVKA